MYDTRSLYIYVKLIYILIAKTHVTRVYKLIENVF